jgi:amino acid transporter
MHPAVKLIVGLIIAIIGIYWYVADFVGTNPVVSWMGYSALAALKQVFIGVFGLFLLFVGLIIAWIEYEDLKWEMKEKKVVAAKPVARRRK